MFENNDRYRSQMPNKSSSMEYARGRQSREGGEGFFCRFTFGQFFALLVLEVFTIFFVFYLGARYGPKLLGLERKGPIVVGEKTTQKVLKTDDPEVAAMAEDIVAKARTPELKERLAKMLKQPSKDASRSAAMATNEPRPQELPEGLTRDIPQEIPAETSTPGETASNELPMRQAKPPEEVEKGAIRIKAAENAKYALQVGSYQQMAEANAAVQKWRSKGYPAYMMIADIPDRGRWYRVRLGGFANRSEARKYKQQFEAQEAVETIVVMNEQ